MNRKGILKIICISALMAVFSASFTACGNNKSDSNESTGTITATTTANSDSSVMDSETTVADTTVSEESTAETEPVVIADLSYLYGGWQKDMEEKGFEILSKAEKSKEQTAEIHDIIEIGDRFRNKLTGDICEVVSLTGALPFYTDDCTITRQSGAFKITENISYDRLFNTDLYVYLGNGNLQTSLELDNVVTLGGKSYTVASIDEEERTVDLRGDNGDYYPTTRTESIADVEAVIEQKKQADELVGRISSPRLDYVITDNGIGVSSLSSRLLSRVCQGLA